MFTKVLIANRGEIACRVIETCHKLGIKTVAIYSDAEPNARHVQMADEAYPLGGVEASESYLNIGRIVEIGVESGAEAVHPGYGFLSENPSFVKACRAAGIRFIGPSPEAMVRMADKVLARQMAAEAGLPLVPGTPGDVSDEEALDVADEIGYPVMVKAAEGGGGIGIRLANDREELEQVLERARSLAQSAFGSARVYLEKYVLRPSHIEVQVVGDDHGNVIHAYERDCSVQRRNQKVIEETPSLKLSQTVLEQITHEAVVFAKHIGYTNAGTVEFIMDAEGDFYFLEMNTRLQVEHGITELVTGLDLVELQLLVAAGEQLPLSQDDIRRRGHAIEARIYPEDPVTFMPQAGTVSRVALPTGQGIRVDHALYPGYEVTPYYEPMIAKLMVWGKNRDEAVRRMLDALQDFQMEGVVSNIPLVRAVLREPSFIRGTYYTDVLSYVKVEPETYTVEVPGTNITLTSESPLPYDIAAAIAEGLQQLNRAEAARSTQASTSGWKVMARREQVYSNQIERL